jgi:hypothetical protein
VLRNLRIDGSPVTFATRLERDWKATLAAKIPPPPALSAEAGFDLRFVLATLAPQGQPLDVDNLCEPVFVVAVRQVGWFGRSKPRVRWWSATKEVGEATGCILSISREDGPAIPVAVPTYREVYRGVMPRSATSPEVADWATTVVRASPTPMPETCIVRLEFGSTKVNIGDISTGVVKSFVDCLYPFFGGRPGAPEDHRVRHLLVQKAIEGLESEQVRVTLWYEGSRVSEPLPSRPARDAVKKQEVRAMNNPCRPGSAKWIVCEGALQGKAVTDVQAELDALKPGTGTRIREYLSDVRAENNLDVRIEGAKLVCRGSLCR